MNAGLAGAVAFVLAAAIGRNADHTMNWTVAMKPSVIVLSVAALLGATVPGQAQNPSPEEIIRSLRPSDATGTRGIRVMTPDQPPPPPISPAPPPAVAPPASAGAALTPAPRRAAAPPPRTATTAAAAPRAVNLTVQFASGSAELTPSATQTIDDLGRALTSNSLSSFRFRIEGHTDTVGAPEMNKALSERRAAKVLDYLVRRWGVDRARLESAGLGQEHLLVPTGPNVAEPTNRRVTVVNLGA